MNPVRVLRNIQTDRLPARLVLYGGIGLPLCCALTWLLLFAIGVHPGQGRYTPTLAFIAQLIEQPALWRSLGLSLLTALIATLLAVALAFWVASQAGPARLARELRPWMAFLLSTPYLAFVVGWQFVIAPSGLLARLVAQFTGQELPPAVATAPDIWFIGYVLMLAVKESGFLLMLLLAQLPSLAVERYYRSGLALGYSTQAVWRKILLPLLYPRLRLGIWVLLAYSATNVEVALFAAPNLPELFSLRIVQWYAEPDLDFQLVAAAGVLLLVLALACLLAIWTLVERALARRLRPWLTNNHRGGSRGEGLFTPARRAMLALYLLPLLLLAIWSVSLNWPFPELAPGGFSLRWWTSFRIGHEMLHSLGLGLMVGLVSLLLALVYVESTRGRTPVGHLWLLYLPLVAPQLALAGGLAIGANFLQFNGSLAAVALGHLLIMLPYMALVLAPAWAGYDERYSQVAASLGYGFWRCWWKVKLPLCIRPTLFALALGISVSVNLYIPTMLLGEGRVTTLMTEMVGLGVSYDRRQLGVFSLWLLLIPLAAFAFASFYPTWRYGRVETLY